MSNLCIVCRKAPRKIYEVATPLQIKVSSRCAACLNRYNEWQRARKGHVRVYEPKMVFDGDSLSGLDSLGSSSSPQDPVTS
jgi:hypothetical protein